MSDYAQFLHPDTYSHYYLTTFYIKLYLCKHYNFYIVIQRTFWWFQTYVCQLCGNLQNNVFIELNSDKCIDLDACLQSHKHGEIWYYTKHTLFILNSIVSVINITFILLTKKAFKYNFISHKFWNFSVCGQLQPAVMCISASPSGPKGD